MGYRCLGRTRWSRRLKGKQLPTFSGISSSRLTKSRTCATIVVFCTNATRSFPNGRKTFIATTSPLVGRGHPGSLLANRTPSKALQRRESAMCTKLEQQNVLALAYDALTLARYLCKSLYLVTIIITNHISLNVAMTFFFFYLPNEPLTDRIGAFDSFLFFFFPYLVTALHLISWKSWEDECLCWFPRAPGCRPLASFLLKFIMNSDILLGFIKLRMIVFVSAGICYSFSHLCCSCMGRVRLLFYFLE